MRARAFRTAAGDAMLTRTFRAHANSRSRLLPSGLAVATSRVRPSRRTGTTSYRVDNVTDSMLAASGPSRETSAGFAPATSHTRRAISAVGIPAASSASHADAAG